MPAPQQAADDDVHSVEEWGAPGEEFLTFPVKQFGPPVSLLAVGEGDSGLFIAIGERVYLVYDKANALRTVAEFCHQMPGRVYQWLLTALHKHFHGRQSYGEHGVEIFTGARADQLGIHAISESLKPPGDH